MLDSLLPELREEFQVLLKDPRSYALSPILLYGPEGGGKSHAAAALAMALIESRWMVTWIDCAALADAPTADEINETALGATVVGASGLVVVDDLGREHRNWRVILGDAMRQRVAANRLLLGTTNAPVEPGGSEDALSQCALVNLYGRSTRSRLLSGMSVLLDGEDRRLPKEER